MSRVVNCGNCNTASEHLLACSKCKQVSYCNKDCQAAHWPAHKAPCKAFAKSAHKKDVVGDICAICLDNLNNGEKLWTLHCNHKFHDACYRTHNGYSSTTSLCPICRAWVGTTRSDGSNKLRGNTPEGVLIMALGFIFQCHHQATKLIDGSQEDEEAYIEERVFLAHRQHGETVFSGLQNALNYIDSLAPGHADTVATTKWIQKLLLLGLIPFVIPERLPTDENYDGKKKKDMEYAPYLQKWFYTFQNKL